LFLFCSFLQDSLGVSLLGFGRVEWSFLELELCGWVGFLSLARNAGRELERTKVVGVLAGVVGHYGWYCGKLGVWVELGRGDKWKRRGVEGEEFSDRFES